MDDKRTDAEGDRDRKSMDPGPDTVDPAPWLGQVGEGATLPAGEAIARVTRELTQSDSDGADAPSTSRLNPPAASTAPDDSAE
jgi:hypothetical protein